MGGTSGQSLCPLEIVGHEFMSYGQVWVLLGCFRWEGKSSFSFFKSPLPGIQVEGLPDRTRDLHKWDFGGLWYFSSTLCQWRKNWVLCQRNPVPSSHTPSTAMVRNLQRRLVKTFKWTYRLSSPYLPKRHQSFHSFHWNFCGHPIKFIVFELVGLAAVMWGAWWLLLSGILRPQLEESNEFCGKATVVIILSLARPVQ